jgi:hypothetical protein
MGGILTSRADCAVTRVTTNAAEFRWRRHRAPRRWRQNQISAASAPNSHAPAARKRLMIVCSSRSHANADNAKASVVTPAIDRSRGPRRACRRCAPHLRLARMAYETDTDSSINAATIATATASPRLRIRCPPAWFATARESPLGPIVLFGMICRSTPLNSRRYDSPAPGAKLNKHLARVARSKTAS